MIHILKLSYLLYETPPSLSAHSKSLKKIDIREWYILFDFSNGDHV